VSNARKLLHRLNGVKKTNSGWSARCPAHEDRNASLSIAEGDGGRVLVRCFAGCDHKKIVAALGLDERDLFDADATPTAAKKKSSSNKATGKPYATADAAQKAYEGTRGKPATVHDYLDEHGVHVGSVIRWQRSPTDKEIRPTSRHAAGWRLEHMPEPRPLLDRRRIVETAGRVYVVEGEKCCDAVNGLGLVATTSSGGSNAASKSDWSPLAGREVVILPDNDDAGRKYAADVAAILHELNPPATVRVVELDGLDKGGDVADSVEACHGDDELKALREKIEQLAGVAEPLQSKAATASTTPAAPRAGSMRSPVEAYRPFPADALPEPLASFVTETASAIGCDPAYVALPLYAVAGAAIGTTRRLELKAGYTVPAILWSVVVGESGTSKSPALRAALEHVRGHEKRLRESSALDRREYEAAIEAYEKERSAWRGDKKATTEPPERPAEPISQRALVTDTTVEALAVKLADNGRGLLLARDELAGWLHGLDRYANKSGGGGSDEAFYLSAYNGEPHAVDRRTGDRREIYVSQAALWITGSIQPAILRRALGQERRESGLLARLLLTAPPARPAKWSEEEVSPLTRQYLHDTLDRLYTLQPETDAEGRDEPRLLRLDADAKKAYVAWHDRHGEELAELTGDRAAAWSKLRETAARISLIVHEIRVANGDAVAADFVDAESMNRALRLAEWHKHETSRVYTILGQSDEETAERQADDRLAAWIERRDGAATAREVLTGCYRWLKTAEEAEAALQRLVDAGRGKWIDKPTTDRGGRPTRLFVLRREVASAQPPRPAAKPGFACADALPAAERAGVAGEEYVEI
jgi:hypothetical protein